jgi:hypothetical protein
MKNNVDITLLKNDNELINFQQKIHKMTKGRIIFSIPPSPPLPFVIFNPIKSKIK